MTLPPGVHRCVPYFVGALNEHSSTDTLKNRNTLPPCTTIGLHAGTKVVMPHHGLVSHAGDPLRICPTAAVRNKPKTA
jgi:hypothetical protein